MPQFMIFMPNYFTNAHCIGLHRVIFTRPEYYGNSITYQNELLTRIIPDRQDTDMPVTGSLRNPGAFHKEVLLPSSIHISKERNLNT